MRNNWRGVVVYPTRSIDTGETERYIELLNSQRVTRIYLDELGTTPQPSIGIGTVQLVVEPEETAGTKARALIDQARLEIADETTKRELIQLIESIIVYKFPQSTRSASFVNSFYWTAALVRQAASDNPPSEETAEESDTTN